MPITITKVITDEQLACLANDLKGFPDDVAAMEADLQRRIDWAIDHKVEQCARRIVETQSHVLGDSRPNDVAKAAVQIATHPNFKTRDKRDADVKAAEEAHAAKKKAERIARENEDKKPIEVPASD